MEGVPPLPMLSALLKTTPDKADFSSKIKWVRLIVKKANALFELLTTIFQQIREHYNEDPISYSNEIRELESLRAAASRPSMDYNGCSLLKKYFCQLHFLQNRFTFEEGSHHEVIFPW